MKFIQNKKDGSCDILFEEREIQIINEKGKLHLPAEGLKDFGNYLVKIVVDWQVYFDNETKKKQTLVDSDIPGE